MSSAVHTLAAVDAEDDRLGFEVVTRVLSAEGREARDLLEEVVRLLEAVLPDQCEVERASRLRGRKVEAVRVEIGDRRFEMTCGTHIAASISTVVRGVVLKTEEISVDAWITQLAEALTREAERNSAARAALARLAL